MSMGRIAILAPGLLWTGLGVRGEVMEFTVPGVEVSAEARCVFSLGWEWNQATAVRTSASTATAVEMAFGPDVDGMLYTAPPGGWSDADLHKIGVACLNFGRSYLSSNDTELARRYLKCSADATSAILLRHPAGAGEVADDAWVRVEALLALRQTVDIEQRNGPFDPPYPPELGSFTRLYPLHPQTPTAQLLLAEPELYAARCPGRGSSLPPNAEIQQHIERALPLLRSALISDDPTTRWRAAEHIAGAMGAQGRYMAAIEQLALIAREVPPSEAERVDLLASALLQSALEARVVLDAWGFLVDLEERLLVAGLAERWMRDLAGLYAGETPPHRSLAVEDCTIFVDDTFLGKGMVLELRDLYPRTRVDSSLFQGGAEGGPRASCPDTPDGLVPIVYVKEARTLLKRLLEERPDSLEVPGAHIARIRLSLAPINGERTEERQAELESAVHDLRAACDIQGSWRTKNHARWTPEIREYREAEMNLRGLLVDTVWGLEACETVAPKGARACTPSLPLARQLDQVDLLGSLYETCFSVTAQTSLLQAWAAGRTALLADTTAEERVVARSALLRHWALARPDLAVEGVTYFRFVHETATMALRLAAEAAVLRHWALARPHLAVELSPRIVHETATMALRLAAEAAGYADISSAAEVPSAPIELSAEDLRFVDEARWYFTHFPEDPKAPLAMTEIGIHLLRRGQCADAAEALRVSMATGPGLSGFTDQDRLSGLAFSAICYEKAGNFSPAITLREEIEAAFPDHKAQSQNLAVLAGDLIEVGRVGDALSIQVRAARDSSASAEVRLNRAIVALRLAYALGDSAIEAVLLPALEPDAAEPFASIEARLVLAEGRLRANRPNDAVMALDPVLRWMDPAGAVARTQPSLVARAAYVRATALAQVGEDVAAKRQLLAADKLMRASAVNGSLDDHLVDCALRAHRVVVEERLTRNCLINAITGQSGAEVARRFSEVFDGCERALGTAPPTPWLDNWREQAARVNDFLAQSVAASPVPPELTEEQVALYEGRRSDLVYEFWTQADDLRNVLLTSLRTADLEERIYGPALESVADLSLGFEAGTRSPVAALGLWSIEQPALVLFMLERHADELHGSPELLTRYGQAALLEGMPFTASRAWSRALEIDPHHSPARASLGLQALRSGDYARAHELLAPIPMAELSGDVDALLGLATAEAFRDGGKADQALHLIDGIKGATTEETTKISSIRAVILARALGRPNLALDALDLDDAGVQELRKVVESWQAEAEEKAARQAEALRVAELGRELARARADACRTRAVELRRALANPLSNCHIGDTELSNYQNILDDVSQLLQEPAAPEIVEEACEILDDVILTLPLECRP